MGDQSAPIPEKVTSELGRIIWKDEGRSMRAVKDGSGHPLREVEGKRRRSCWTRAGEPRSSSLLGMTKKNDMREVL
jgi:hypothetical protein